MNRNPRGSGTRLSFILAGLLLCGCLYGQSASVTLTTSANLTTLGQPVTLTAILNPPTATGKVTFYDGTSILGTTAVAAGQANLTTKMLPSGSRLLKAYYLGAATFSAGTSNTVQVTVRALAGNSFQTVGPNDYGGVYSQFIAVADINGDGATDLIVGGYPQGGIPDLLILLGTGTGAFNATSYPVYPGPVVVADFNGDGKPDIATGNYILLSSATGLRNPVPIAGGDGVPAVGDFNGDGKADLIVSNSASGIVTILIGNGDGTFQTPRTYQGTGSPVVADFNGDGIADLALANSGGVSVFLGNGDGTFRPGVTTGPPAGFIVAGDFNGDGKADLAVAFGLNISVLIGIGDGTFRPALNYSAGSQGIPDDALEGIVTGDFNGDGKADLAVVYAIDSKAYVLLGNGDGTFQTTLAYFAPHNNDFSCLAVGDFNGDGRTDLAIGGGSITVLLGVVLPVPAITLASSPDPSIYGQNVSLIVALSPANATGSVTFYDGNTALGTQALVNGKASLADSLLSIGAHSLTAIYGGDTNFGPGHSNLLVHTVNRAANASTTILTSTSNPSPFGHNLTLIATVPFAATGTVIFYDGTSIVGNAAVVNGRALLSTSLLPSGTRSLKAIYSGDATYAGSSSAVLLQTVQSLPATGFRLLTAGNATGFVDLAMGDFNGDGITDLAAIEYSDNYDIVTVYLGNGNGTFKPPVNYPTNGASSAVAVGDFNRDGKTDLVVCGGNSYHLSILLGNGDGTFQPPVLYGIGSGAFAAIVADLNGDGKLDLVAVGGTGTLYILLGNGDGTFFPASSLDTGVIGQSFAVQGPSVAVGDFNGDGRADLALTDHSRNKVIVYLGQGDGAFQPGVTYAAGTGPEFVAVADVNGDGKADLAVADYDSNSVSVLFGNGDGSFQPPLTYAVGSHPYAIAVGDLNGDGVADLAVANLFDANVGVLLGKGDGTFSPAVNYATNPGPGLVFVTDVNGDGRADLVVTTYTFLNVLLGETQTTTSLSSSANPSIYGQSVTLNAAVSPSNVTGTVTFYDGTAVLGTRTLVNGQASLTTSLLASGTRPLTAYYSGDATFAPSTSSLTQTVNPVPAKGFQTAVNYSAGTGPAAMALGDFNGDGKSDIAIVNQTSNNVSVLLNNGEGTFRAAINSAAGPAPTCLAVADFNGDGIADLAIGHGVAGNVTILLGNGDGTFRAGVNYAVGSNSYSLAAGDFNRDGSVDLVVANYSSSSVSILLGNGDGTLQAAINLITDPSPRWVEVGDFNRDGNPDVAVVTTGGQSLNVFLGNGGGTFRQSHFSNLSGAPSAAAVADFNGDGNPDIAVSLLGNNVSVPLGIGNGQFQSPVNYAVGAPAAAIAAADINGDGKVDLILACPGGAVVVLLGNGDGTFQPAASYGPGTQPIAIAVGDFNGDGRADLAVTNQNGTVSILFGKPSLTGAAMPGARVGVFRNGVAFLEDSNGNTTYDAGVDRYIPSFTGTGGFVTGDVPVIGDWTGDGNAKVGIYRTSTGTWFLDANNNGVFDAGDYQYQFGGLAGDIPFSGDWNGLGKSCIGIYRSIGSVWLLDLNCDGVFDNAPKDAFFPFGGVAGDVPVVGAWTGTTTRVGVVRKYAPAGIPQGNPFYWVLDAGAANAGSAAASHQPGFTFAFGGLAGDVFVTGDWNNTGTSAAGVYRAGLWVLDAALPSAPQASHVPGLTFGYGGLAGDVPVTGKW